MTDTVTIPLTRGLSALVDANDAPRVLAAGKWHASETPRGAYAYRTVRRADGSRTRLGLHSFLTGFEVTDHINGDSLDNRRANLREATRALNNANARLRRDNPTGFKGVSRRGRRWRARIGAGGRQIGTFDTAIEAARAYDAEATRLYGEFARLNFPKENAA